MTRINRKEMLIDNPQMTSFRSKSRLLRNGPTQLKLQFLKKYNFKKVEGLKICSSFKAFNCIKK